MRAAIRHSGTQGRSIPLLAIEMLGLAFSYGMPEKTRNNRICSTALVPDIRVPHVVRGPSLRRAMTVPSSSAAPAPIPIGRRKLGFVGDSRPGP